MSKCIKKVCVLSMFAVLLLGCFLAAGCDETKSKRLAYEGSVASVAVDTTTIEEALAGVTLTFDGENLTDDKGNVATGYAAMRSAGAHVSWSGNSQRVKDEQTKGNKPVIVITYNFETIYIEYVIN